MDLRHGFCQTWRRSSQAPPSVRSCTPASAVIPVQRRLTPRRRAGKQCLAASCAVAIHSTYEQSAASTASDEPAPFEVHESQGFCSPDAVCPAVLQTRLSKAHTSAASAALVVQDSPDEKLVATASLDKGMAIWRFYSSQMEGENPDASSDESIEVTRLKVPGAPVFSLAKIPEVLPDGTIVRKRPKPPGIYLGTSSKEVLAWMLGSKDVTDKVVLDGHTGWVRSLAVTGKWLFSCGCNYLRLWDTTFRTPKECDAVRLFTGDILAIAAFDGRVFTAGADGSLRSWTITRAGELHEGPSRDKAHDGRVSAVAEWAGRVFTVSYDGSIKAWDADTLELVAEVKGAHNGDKIFCTAVGANGVIFTGGDDKLLRAWDHDLNPVGLPLEGHGAAVRVLSAGRRALLVSGDADGDVCIWETYPVDLPSVAKPLTAAAAPEPLTAAAGAAIALDGSAALAAGVAWEPSAVEVTVGEAAMQQLETMFAAPHTELPQREELGAAAAYDDAAVVPAAEWQAADQQSAAAYALDNPAAVSEAEQQQQLEENCPPAVLEQEQALQHVAGELLMPQAAGPEQQGLSDAEWQQVQSHVAPDAAAALEMEVGADEASAIGPASAELIVDGLTGPYGSGATCHEVAVAPLVNGNGSGGFAVMAATVSESVSGHFPHAEVTAELEEQEQQQQPSHRQIEVESVASAVAAACLAKGVDGRTSLAAGTRWRPR